MPAREFTAVALWIAATASAAAAGSTTLSPDEIGAAFGTGTSFTAVSRSGTAYSFALKPDGIALEVPKGQAKGATGRWHLSQTGYCTTWSGSKEHCYTVEKSDNGYKVRDAAGGVVATWALATPSSTKSAPAVHAVQSARSASVQASGVYADGAYTGPVEDAYYGLVQVQVVVQGGRLSRIDVLRYPSDRSTSIAINHRALPKLIAEVVKAQSASVDVVTGATLSSAAFIRSLSAALKQTQG